MPRFILLSDFNALYVDQSQLLTDEGLAAFMQRLQSPEGETIANQKGINHFDFLCFVESLKNPQLILFHSWVEENPDLLKFLEGKKIEHTFFDKKQHLKHQWGEDFKKFLSPYVVERLLKEATEDLEELSKLFSFTAFIINDDRVVVEAELFKPIRKRLERTKHSEIISEEQRLIEFVKPLCSDEIILSVNLLSKGSYSLKLEYVDTILETIRAKGCTVRFANWIIKKMEEIQLNDEHNLKLYSLRKELQDGKLTVRNHGEGRTPIRWKKLIVAAFIALLIGFIFIVVYYKPFNNVTDSGGGTGESFKELSKDEQESIDSLIRIMDNEELPSEYDFDRGELSPVEID